MGLADMIVKPGGGRDEYGVNCWTVNRGSRRFLITRNHRGDWSTWDLDQEDGSPACGDVSGDLSGSLEYIDSLFR